MAHSAGDMASPSREAASFLEGTVVWQTDDTCEGINGDGKAQKNASIVAATSWAWVCSAICTRNKGQSSLSANCHASKILLILELNCKIESLVDVHWRLLQLQFSFWDAKTKVCISHAKANLSENVFCSQKKQCKTRIGICHRWKSEEYPRHSTVYLSGNPHDHQDSSGWDTLPFDLCLELHVLRTLRETFL